MNISENKRVFGISVLFLVAFGGLMYVGYSSSSEASEGEEKLLDIADKYKRIGRADVTPSAENLKTLRKISNEVEQESKALSSEFRAYRNYCISTGEKKEPGDYQKTIMKERGEMQALAQQKGCQLNGNAADYGLDKRAFDSFPEAAKVHVLSFQHRALHDLITGMINDGVKAVDMIYNAPLPESTYAAGESEENDWKYQPLRTEIDIRVPRGVLPAVIKRLVTDKQYFVSITGLSVRNESPLDPVDAVAPPATTEDGSPAPVAPDKAIAVIKAGRPDDTVRVHLNLEILYFNPLAQ